ncbi:hypothetical protein [Asticcacaulis tiandongensis]|uniref:hypothetical protein n=1 Tax=Asticcacaulis tiandongensis TaxID=2565365 RepID=UPI00112B11A2|nr:hypothetical protein [Asticcacaulis tiandongensis]
MRALMLMGVLSSLMCACSPRDDTETVVSSVAVPDASQVAEAVWRTESVPAEWRGLWAAGKSDCETGESRLVIEGDRLIFWESSGRVIRATGQGDQITIEAEMTGEGEVWKDSFRFVKSADGQYIDMLLDDGAAFRRHRC